MNHRFVLLALALPVAAAAAPTVAMNGHLPSASDLDGMVSLGVVAVRMDFNWYDFERSRGTKDFAYLDPVVEGAHTRNLAIYATVAYTPQWASSVPTCTPFSTNEDARCENKLPASTTDWTSAVSAVVTRYKGKVECWGIWNEPNLHGFFDGSIDDFVTKIFVPAAQAIRTADAAAKICGPELAGLTKSSNWHGNDGTCPIPNQCIRNGWEMDLAEMLDRVGAYIDVVTHHFYKADAAGVMGAVLDGEYFGTLLLHDSAKHVVESHGGAGKPFWLTETGWEHPPQGTMSLADVATRIVGLYAKQEEVCAGTYAASTNDPWPNWTRTYYFHYPYDPGSGWGIIDSNGSPLPPYTALQGWTSGRTTSACTGPTIPRDGGFADAGTPNDAGTPADSGPAPDSGSRPDSGSTFDAGQTQDAGAGRDGGGGQPDAGEAPDAASQPDSGPLVDAGANADGGGGAVGEPGCACGTGVPQMAFAALLALALRRRRSAAPVTHSKERAARTR